MCDAAFDSDGMPLSWLIGTGRVWKAGKFYFAMQMIDQDA